MDSWHGWLLQKLAMFWMKASSGKRSFCRPLTTERGEFTAANLPRTTITAGSPLPQRRLEYARGIISGPRSSCSIPMNLTSSRSLGFSRSRSAFHRIRWNRLHLERLDFFGRCLYGNGFRRGFANTQKNDPYETLNSRSRTQNFSRWNTGVQSSVRCRESVRQDLRTARRQRHRRWRAAVWPAPRILWHRHVQISELLPTPRQSVVVFYSRNRSSSAYQ